MRFKSEELFSIVYMKQLNPSLKHHVVIGALLCLWSFLFAFFTRPFEHGTMDLNKWIYVSVGFSLASFISYLIVGVYQRIIFFKTMKWSTFFEISTYVLYYGIYAVITYIYYRSEIIDGIYTFPRFFTDIILNIILIVTPILFLARRYSIKLIPKKEEKITIKGDNKLDFLKIKKSELICISNSQNYVEVFFLENEQLKTKLIRSSLKKMQYDFDFLVQIH